MKDSKQIALILFLLFSSTNFLNLRAFQFIPFDIINLALSIYFIIYSIVKSKSGTGNIEYYNLTTSFIKIFLVASLLAAITAFVDWGQSVIISIVACRTVLWIFLGYYFIKSNTKLEELKTAFSIFTWVYLFFTLIVVISPELKAKLLFLDEDNAHKIDEVAFNGFMYLLIPFYFALDKLVTKVKFERLDLVQFLLIIFAAVSLENRSTLFPMIVILFFSIVFNFNANIIRSILIALVIMGFSIIFAFDVLNELINETTEQLSDEEYPRIRGLIYFSNSFAKSNLGFYFGNSVGSKKVEYGQFMDSLKKFDGLYISDLGLFGTWVHFGILAIIAIFFPIYKIFASARENRVFKYLVSHMFMGWALFLFLPETTFVFFISVLYMFEYSRMPKLSIVKM